MPTDITDVDEFTSPVRRPDNGEPADADTLTDLTIQRLANRTRNNKNRLDGHDTDIAAVETDVAALQTDVAELQQAHSLICTVGGTAVAVADRLTLTAYLNFGGFSVSSNNITVPLAGVYGVAPDFDATVSPSGSIARATVRVYVNDTDLFWYRAYRYDTGSGTAVRIVGAERLVTITDPATQTINLRNGEHSLTVVSGGSDNDKINSFVVRYLGQSA